jgi:hypothetical protein
VRLSHVRATSHLLVCCGVSDSAEIWGVRTLPWTQLYAYGTGENVFLLQFTGVSTFQIFAGAFPREEWRAFQSFLTTNYPDKKASFWFGPKEIRWKRNA